MSLYHKYRPTKFKHIHGNEETVQALRNKLKDLDTFPHAILFKGPKGNGKTTMARLVAERLGVKGADLRELDTADFRGIDSVRTIIKQSQYKALEGKAKMWILDEAHQLTNDAQNALLKILEEPPSHVYFVLCTTDPQKLIPTVRDRCSQFEVKPLSNKEMAKLLAKVCKAEGEPVQKEVIVQITKDSGGHPRFGLQILDKVLSVDPNKRMEAAKQAEVVENQSIDLCRALIKGDPWKKVANILKGLKDEDPESIRRHVLGYAQSVLLKGSNDRAGAILEEFIHPFYNSGFPGLTYACYLISRG